MRRFSFLAVVPVLACLALAPAGAGAQGLGIESGSFEAGSYAGEGVGRYAPFGAGAGADTRAGGHPFLAATSFALSTHPVGTGYLPDGAVRDVVVDLPPGFLGNPLAMPRCRQETLMNQTVCPNEDAIGIAYVTLTLSPWATEGAFGHLEPSQFLATPVFNLEPGFGEPALFGFYIVNPGFTVLVRLRLDPSRGYAVTAVVPNISGLGTTFASRLAIWGAPAASTHDQWRGFGEKQLLEPVGCLKSPFEVDLGPQSTGGSCVGPTPIRPFLADPASCDGQPVTTTIHVDSWEHPGRVDADGEPDLGDPNWGSATAESPPVEGCDQLEFGGPEAPVAFTDRPDNTAADTPAGHTLELTLPYNDDPEGLANPPLRDTTIRFPAGETLNSAAASGLQACSPAQIGLTTAVGRMPARFTGRAPECPGASRLGTVEVETPLIDHVLKGTLYQATQHDNPFESLLAVYLAVEDPESGTIVKLPGELVADRQTGDLTARFSDSPQLPFTRLTVRTKGGSTAPLVNPRTCGPKTTSGEFTPWSAPQSGPPAQTTSGWTQSEGAGGICPNTLANRNFGPGFEAGVAEARVNAESPFNLRLTRPEGSQEFDRLEVTTPPGFAATLNGVATCSDASIAQAEGRDEAGDGALEKASPSCPADSQVGTTTIGVGAGSSPYYVSGKAYLAGPYKGGPLSLVFVVPAVAGPFDLGVQVVRTALELDSATGQITARSDSIPRMLEGIPLRIRDIRVSVDRPHFPVNPTSCDVYAVSGTAHGSNGASAPLSSRFQLGGCGEIGFKPRLRTRLKGGTRRNKYPALIATLRTRPGDANVGKRVVVTLPHSEFLEQAHIRTVCTRVQFNEGAGNGANCPAASVYGHARAVTPLLSYPLEGNVYLRSNGGERLLPDLVVALQGPDWQPIRINLVGFISSHRKGIRTTFAAVPDERISTFTLSMFGGKRGLLVNSRNLCSGRRPRVEAEIDGQNGMTADQRPVLRNQCHKHRKRKARRGKHRHRSKRVSLMRRLSW